MPSHSKKDKGFARCLKCSRRGRWAYYCVGCNDGDRFKKKAYLISEKQRVIGEFQQLKPRKIDDLNSDASDSFQQEINSFQQEIPPSIVSGETITDRVLSLLMLGFPLHYTQISKILGEGEKTVNMILNRFVKDKNNPVSRELNSNGRTNPGRYMIDPGLKLELELLDKPLKLHNIRLYPDLPRSNFQQFMWEGGIFSTLIQHLPSINLPRADGGIFWPDDFLGRKVSFVSHGKGFWIELSTTNQSLDIPMLWEYIKWVADKFGNDTYRYNWKMAFEPNQDLTPLEMIGGGMVELSIAGRLFRAYQKWYNDSSGRAVLRVEQGRSESKAIELIVDGKIDRKHVEGLIERHGTLRGALDEMQELKGKMEVLINEISDANSNKWSNTEFLTDAKNLTSHATDLVTLIDIMMEDRKILVENLTQVTLNQKALIELMKAIGVKPEINVEAKPFEEQDSIIYR